MKRSLISLFGGLVASGLFAVPHFGTHVYSYWKEPGWQGFDRLGCAALPLVANGETALIPVEGWDAEEPLTKEMVVILHGNTTDKNFGAIKVESDEALFKRLGKQTPDEELEQDGEGFNPVGFERTYYDKVEYTEGWYASWPIEVWPGCSKYEDGRDHKPKAGRWWIEIPIKADADGRRLFFSVGITGQELTSKTIYLISDSKEILEAGNFLREFGSGAKFAIKNRGKTSGNAQFLAADYVPIRPSDYTRDWWPDYTWPDNAKVDKYKYVPGRSYIGHEIDAAYQKSLGAGDNRKGVPYTAFAMPIKTDYSDKGVGTKTAFVAPEDGRLVLSLSDDDQLFRLKNSTLEAYTKKRAQSVTTDAQRRFWFYNTIDTGTVYEVDLKAGDAAVFSYPYDREFDEDNASLFIGRLAFFPAEGKSISVTGSWSTLRYQKGQPFPYAPGVVIGGGVYREGEEISLKAVSYPGHEFDRWEVVYLGKRSSTISTPAEVRAAIEAANATHTPEVVFPAASGICAGASDEAAIVVRAHWKDIQIAQVQTDPLDVSKYKGGRPSGNGLVVDGHKQTFSAPESVATGAKDGKVYTFTHWELGPDAAVSAAGGVALAATGTQVADATFETAVAINATTPVTTYVAHYETGYPIKTAVTPAKSGTVEGPSAGVVGREVTLKAIPAQYYRFVRWVDTTTKAEVWTKATYTFPMPKRLVSLSATFEKIPVTVTLEVPGGTESGTATGGKETLAGTKLTLKATPAKGKVFAGWYRDEAYTDPAVFPDGTDYRTDSVSFAPTGEASTETFYARFVATEKDQEVTISAPANSYAAGEEVSETLSVSSLSLPKVTVKGLPTGMKFDAKTLKLTGKPTKPGLYAVTFEATNASVKKATDSTRLALEITIRNFIDSALPISDSYGEETLIIPGVTQEIPLGADTTGWSATGLPTGMKFDAKTGTFTGTPTKPGRYTVVFTKKIDKETHTVSTTVIVADFPQLTVLVRESDKDPGDVTASSATGSGAYAANKGVRLAAKPAKGYVFGGWCDAEGAELDGLTVDYRTASVTWPMAESDTTVYADFYPAEMDAVISSILLSDGGETYAPENELGIEAGEPVEVAVEVSSISLPKIAVKGLPAGLKFDAKTNKITGKATTPGLYELTVSVTNTTIKTADAYSTAIFRLRVANYVDEEIPLPDVLTPVKPNLTIEPIILEDALGCTVKGLPTGVKWDVKTGTLSGKPTKPGYYTLIFSKKIGKETHTASTLFEVLPFPRLTIEGEMGEGTLRGTVKGAGNYPAGTKVKLTATPKAGYVFAGWAPLEHEEGSSTYVDPRTPSITYIMGEEDAMLMATFVSTAADEMSIQAGLELVGAGADYALDLAPDEDVEIEVYECSYSLPTITLKGLPAGLKYDAKRKMVVGKPTKPGVYTVTMSITNASVKTVSAANTCTALLRVLNIDQIGLSDVYEPVRIPAGEEAHGDARFEELVGATASGLPSGLKWDAKTGTLSGVAWKAGDYTVTFTKGKLKATLTFTVEAEPPAIVLDTLDAGEEIAGLVGEPYLFEGMLMVSSSPTTELRPKVTLRGLPSGCKSELTDIGEGCYAVSLSGNFPTAAARYLVEFVATDAKTGLEAVTPLTLRAYDVASLWGEWALYGTIYGTALAYCVAEDGVWHATISQANAKGSATLQLTGYSELSLKLVKSSLQDGGVIRTYQTVKGKERFTLVHQSSYDVVRLSIEIWDSEADDYVEVDAMESYGVSWIKPLTVYDEFPLAAKTYTITGEVCIDGEEEELISHLSGSLTLKATGEATAKLTTTNPKASFSLTGGVLDDGHILLIGRSPSGFVDAGEPMTIDLMPGCFELSAGSVWGLGTLTEGPFPSME